MKTLPTIPEVLSFLQELPPEELLVLAASDNRPRVRALAQELIAAEVAMFLPEALTDEELPERLQEVAAKWRRLLAELGCPATWPVAYRVKAGFTLKEHAPKTGECYKGWAGLQSWNLKNDAPTSDAIVFWVPRLLTGSTGKNVPGQLALLTETRTRLMLPEHHCASFGSAALLSALILYHRKRTGERVPLQRLWSRTDTLLAAGHRLALGFFGGCGLRCDGWCWDGHESDFLGCFALGVEST